MGLTQEIMGMSQYFEGEPQEGWELVGILDNGACYIRYYQEPGGGYRHTAQRKRGRPKAEIAVREDGQGRTFARRVYPRRKKKKRMA
ncbi:MAG: hypothetical protein HFH43_08780 [Lachnospiraceae bacterium]|nr:hypothetical protein [Lachnospiraceae bacterium]